MNYTRRRKYLRMSKHQQLVESGSQLPHSKVRLRHILASRAAALECGALAPLFFAPLMCASIYDAAYRFRNRYCPGWTHAGRRVTIETGDGLTVIL